MVRAGNQKGTPLHDQIRAQLLAAITGGQLQPGDRVPSEWALAERFGVSRMTARKALSDLVLRGWLRRQQGKGTFVAAQELAPPLAELTSFTEEMRRRGLSPSTRVLAVGAIPANQRVAEHLGIAEAAPVYRLQRLRLADGVPMALDTAHIPTSYAPDLLVGRALTQSLYGLLEEQYAIRLTRATQTLEVVTAQLREQELLHVGEGTPLLLLERVARDESDRPVEYGQTLYRGDRYRFTADLDWHHGS